MKTAAFIGTGNMGSALARAAAKSGQPLRLLLANRTLEKAEALAKELGGQTVDNKTAAAEADILFLGVKPHLLEGMLNGIRETLRGRKDRYMVVSMIAGKDLHTLSRLLGEVPVIRVMPNIPVAIGSGISLYAASKEVTQDEKALFCDLMAASGLVEEIDENLMDAATGITGCGPAFAAMFTEALADGAVACGLPRAQAYRCAAQMLKGTAELLLETGEHPASLKDRVCSPAGSTIQGVRELERSAFRAAVMNAVIASYEKEF